MALAPAACAGDPRGETTRATYDERTGRLKEIAHDADGDGRIDTWTEMEGKRPLRARIDRDGDSRIDRWEYYDARGDLVRVGFLRASGDVPDAWAFPPENGVVRVEVSSSRDEARIDRWERYRLDPASAHGLGTLLAVEEDTTGDGRADRWEIYETEALRSVAFDETGDGLADRRMTYERGQLLLIETEPDGAGSFARRVRVD